MPIPSQWLHFGPFRLDRQHAALWKGDDPLPLRPQALSVLQYLAERPGQVIPAQELMNQNWAETYVTDTVLRVCIRDIRQVLQDNATKSQYVQTVRGQGYRFCGHVENPSPAHRINESAGNARTIVGREQSLGQLHAGFQRAAGGQLQVLFVSGEAGMGKTTVVDAFLAQLLDSEPVPIGRGQCAEHVGPGEAYMPVLEALGRLGRKPGGERLVAALHRAAPTWLPHLPLLFPDAPHHAHDTIPVRMQRELVDALALLAAQSPLVLVFEDLHWSDTATADLLTYIARRREASQLLVIGTYRPADLALENHTLHERIQDLWAHELCQVHTLPPLTEADVAAYVSQRLKGPAAPELIPLLHECSGGNALFMVNALTCLLEQHGVQQHHGYWTISTEKLAAFMDIPAGVRQLISRQIEMLPLRAQLMLEIASIAGDEFAVAAVATVLSRPVETVERQCAAIARMGYILEATGLATWPDGMISSRYLFRHTRAQNLVGGGLA